MSDRLALTPALPEPALILSQCRNPSFLPRDQFDPFVTLILCWIS